MSQAIAASQHPFSEGREQFRKLAATLAAEQAALPPWEKQKYVLTSRVVPSVGATFNATERTIAQRDSLIVAIAAERYRLKHGEYPAQIGELVPDLLPVVPDHPADGKPLSVTKGDGDLVIESVVLRAKKMQSESNSNRE